MKKNELTSRLFAFFVAATMVIGVAGIVPTVAYAQSQGEFNKEFAPDTDTQKQTTGQARQMYVWIMNLIFYGIGAVGIIWYLAGGGMKAVGYAGGALAFVGAFELVQRFMFRNAGITLLGIDT